MATPGYIFGVGTGVATPEELAHRRRWAQAMIQSGTERTPQDPWEGLASIARAVSGSYTNFKADREEEKGRAGADEAYRPIANALVSSSKPTGDELNAALSNPWMSDGQKMIAQQLFKSQYGDSEEGGYGLNLVYGTDANGNTVAFRPSKGGGVRPLPVPEGVKLTPGSNSKTGAVVSGTPKDIAGKAAQEEIGTAQGKAEAAAPGDYQAGQNALDLVTSIRNDPYKGRGTGFSSIFNAVPGTGGYDFQNKVGQAKSGAFLTAIQQMRGLRALSNAEGSTAAAAVNRMNTATSEEEFNSALDDYERIVTQGMQRAQKRLPQATQPPPGEGGNSFASDPRFGQMVNGYKIGQTAKNPQTGEMITWDGNGWRQ